MSKQTETEDVKYAIQIENVARGVVFFNLSHFHPDAMPGARWDAICKALKQSGWPVGVGDIIKVVELG